MLLGRRVLGVSQSLAAASEQTARERAVSTFISFVVVLVAVNDSWSSGMNQ